MNEEYEPRLWWPGFLCDEVMPRGAEHPQTWLDEQDDGTYLFGAVEIDEEGRFPEAQTVEVGETLRFRYLDRLARRAITVQADRTYRVQCPACGAELHTVAIPEGYTDVLEVGEPDTQSPSLAALVENIAGLLSPGEEETAVIDFFRWGDSSFTLGLTDRQRPLLIPVSEPADA